MSSCLLHLISSVYCALPLSKHPCSACIAALNSLSIKLTAMLDTPQDDGTFNNYMYHDVFDNYPR